MERFETRVLEKLNDGMFGLSLIVAAGEGNASLASVSRAPAICIP